MDAERALEFAGPRNTPAISLACLQKARGLAACRDLRTSRVNFTVNLPVLHMLTRTSPGIMSNPAASGEQSDLERYNWDLVLTKLVPTLTEPLNTGTAPDVPEPEELDPELEYPLVGPRTSHPLLTIEPEPQTP